MTCAHDGPSSPSPRSSPEVIDWTAGTATSTTTWSCMDCGQDLETEQRVRQLVRPEDQPRRKGVYSPDRGMDRMSSGGTV